MHFHLLPLECSDAKNIEIDAKLLRICNARDEIIFNFVPLKL